MHLLKMSVAELFIKYPKLKSFIASMGLPTDDFKGSLEALIFSIDSLTMEDIGYSHDELLEVTQAFIEHLELTKNHKTTINSLTIIGGFDKQGQPERCCLTIKPGEIVSVVGPTGSGKSRLLEDIEWIAQGDTPTGRKILLEGDLPQACPDLFYAQKLVAQLSQHMNFVMDVTVQDFIMMHAESRMIDEVPDIVNQVLQQANCLSGEAIAKQMYITSLSGGQSRALMIADIACLSQSPVVLIDEIENAGINRNQALDLLVQNEKIVLMATHDPILALLGHKRLVMKNGRIEKIIEKTEGETLLLAQLQEMESYLNSIRQKLREGLAL